jgi:hypothetical protein
MIGMRTLTKHYWVKSGGILLLSLLLGLLFTYISQARAAGSNDLGQLASASEQLLLGERSITLIHRQIIGRYTDTKKLARLADEWARTLDLPSHSSGESNLIHGAPVYLMESNLDSHTKLTLQLSVLPDQTIYAFLKLHTFGSSIETNQSFSAHRANLELALSKLGSEPNWNMIIQGRLSKQTEANQSHLQSLFQAKLVEAYSDVRTNSWTFYTPSIHQKIISGSQPVNLQINVHRNTEDQVPFITIGMPLITTDGLFP